MITQDHKVLLDILTDDIKGYLEQYESLFDTPVEEQLEYITKNLSK